MKSKKKVHIFPILLLLLAAVAAGVCIYFYPKWKAAGVLQESLTSGHFTYELEIRLDRDAMDAKQEETLENLSKLTGFGKEALFQFTIRGSVWEDKIHALFYPKDVERPLIELYLSSDMSVINETLPFNTIRENLVEQHKLLDHIMPAQLEAVYMTLEQAEQIFDLDLSGIRELELLRSDKELSRVKCFLLLAAMKGGSSEEGSFYELSAEGADLKVELRDAVPVLCFDVQEPGTALQQAEEYLSRLNLEMPGWQAAMLESISGTVMPGQGEEIVLPDKLMDQKKADLLVEIRDLIRKIGGFFD